MSSIFLMTDTSTLTELTLQPYELEAHLQQIISGSPRVLDSVLGSMNDTRWKLVKREFPVPGSSGKYKLDAVFLDQEGVPVLAEVKRASNTQIRREIIGQLVDYIHNFLENVECKLLRQYFEERCRERSTTPEAELDDLLLGQSSEGYWDQVEDNLQSGRIRVAVIADDIPLDLQRNIEGLNKRMPTVSFVAIAVRQYANKENGVRVIVSEDCSRLPEAVPRDVPRLTTPATQPSTKLAVSRPSSWEDAAGFIYDQEMQAMLLEEARTHGGSVSVRKIYYVVDDIMRWRLKVQRSSVNVYQQMRFVDDLAKWRSLFPELSNGIRTPDEGRQLSFNLANAKQLRSFLEFVHAVEAKKQIVEFMPRGTVGARI